MPYKEIEQKKEGQAKPMCSPFECEEVGHLQPVARSSVPHDSQNMKGRDGARDVLVILVIVAVFAGALVFILSRKRGSAAFGSSQGTLEGLAANSMNEQEQNKIVVLCGFRGSGKTTFAQTLLKPQFNIVVYDPNEDPLTIGFRTLRTP